MRRPLIFSSGAVFGGIFALLISFGLCENGTSQAAPGDPKDLLEKRLAAAQDVYDANFKRLQSGELQIDERLMSWSERWLNSQLALSRKPAEEIAALQAHLKRLEEIEKIFAAYVRAGQARTSDAEAATYFRIDAEIRLREAEQN